MKTSDKKGARRLIPDTDPNANGLDVQGTGRSSAEMRNVDSAYHVTGKSVYLDDIPVQQGTLYALSLIHI